MNKLITTIVTTIIAACVGCKSIPTVDEMSTLGTVSGYTTAYILNNQAKVDDSTRNAICEIMPVVEQYIPSTNETFASTWTPMVKNLVNKYVSEGKMTQAQADRVVRDFEYIVGLLDAYIDKKGIHQYQDLTNAFIHSFCDSFLKNFKPANVFKATRQELDEFTEEFLTKTMVND